MTIIRTEDVPLFCTAFVYLYCWTGVTCFRAAMLRHYCQCCMPTVKTSFVFYMSCLVIYSEFTGLLFAYLLTQSGHAETDLKPLH